MLANAIFVVLCLYLYVLAQTPFMYLFFSFTIESFWLRYVTHSQGMEYVRCD